MNEIRKATITIFEEENLGGKKNKPRDRERCKKLRKNTHTLKLHQIFVPQPISFLAWPLLTLTNDMALGKSFLTDPDSWYLYVMSTFLLC